MTILGIIGSSKYSEIFVIKKHIPVPTARVIILFLKSIAVKVITEMINRFFEKKTDKIACRCCFFTLYFY